MNSKPSILYVDDEPSNLVSFKFQFQEYYNISTASSAEEGLAHLRENPAQVVLSDQRMPQVTGVEFFERVRKEFPNSLRMILTGYSNIDAVIEAINKGKIYYYLSKPWNENELRLIIDNALEVQRIQKEKLDLSSRYQAIVEDQTECIVRWQTSGLITFANASFIEEFCLKETPLESVSFPQTIAQTDASLWIAENSDTSKPRNSFNSENLVKTPEGKKMWHHWTHRPIYDQTGALHEFQSVGFEITQLKETELNLAKARKIAENANKAKDTFLAMMSHEMRTPLNPIMGFTSLMLSLEEDPEKREHLDVIMESSQRMLDLIDKILNYAQIENGKFSIQNEKFRLVGFLKSTLSMISTQSNGNQLTLECPSIDDSTMVDFDIGKLSQILINLLSNACKFTNDGHVQLSVIQENIEANRSKFTFSVEDNGIGIAEEKLDQIFKPFTQIEDSFSREYEGLGLGLAITQKLLDALQGSISVESEPNKGSTFTFHFEANVENTSQIKTKNLEVEIRSDAPEVLIVQDAFSEKPILKELLENLGGVVSTSETSENVLSRVKENAMKLIFIELNHPQKDQAHLLDDLKRSSPSTPVIAITAHAEKAFIQDLIDAGFNDCMVKPITLQSLSPLLKKWIPIENSCILE